MAILRVILGADKTVVDSDTTPVTLSLIYSASDPYSLDGATIFLYVDGQTKIIGKTTTAGQSTYTQPYSVGTHTIYATIAGISSQAITITVKAPAPELHVTSVTITEANGQRQISTQTPLQFTVKLLDQNGNLFNQPRIVYLVMNSTMKDAQTITGTGSFTVNSIPNIGTYSFYFLDQNSQISSDVWFVKVQDSVATPQPLPLPDTQQVAVSDNTIIFGLLGLGAIAAAVVFARRK